MFSDGAGRSDRDRHHRQPRSRPVRWRWPPPGILGCFPGATGGEQPSRISKTDYSLGEPLESKEERAEGSRSRVCTRSLRARS